jgi:hypothetical protein
VLYTEKLHIYAKQHDLRRLLFTADSEDNVLRRDKFCYPKVEPDVNDSPECIYLCGNSLGLQPIKAREYINEELDRCSAHGICIHIINQLCCD